MGFHHHVVLSVTTSPLSQDTDASEQKSSWHQEIDALTLVIDSYEETKAQIRWPIHASIDRGRLAGSERSASTDLATVKLPTTLEASKDTNDEVGDRAHHSAALAGIRHVRLSPRQIADTCADTAYLLLRDKRPVTNAHA